MWRPIEVLGAISAIPITVSKAVPGTSKRCSGMRLIPCVAVAAAGGACCADAGLSQRADAVQTAKIDVLTWIS